MALEIPAQADAQTYEGSANNNFGVNGNLRVDGASGNKRYTYLRFDLDRFLPAGATPSQVKRAVMRLFVNDVGTAGSFSVYYPTATWNEGTKSSGTAGTDELKWTGQPGVGDSMGSVSVAASDKQKFIPIDITSVVQDWLNGTPNRGLVLRAFGTANIYFDSKENVDTSHHPVLDVELVSSEPSDPNLNAIADGTWTGSNSITTVGTVTSGTWAGSAISVASGGTGSTNGSIIGLGTVSISAGGLNSDIVLSPTGTGGVFVQGIRVGTGTGVGASTNTALGFETLMNNTTGTGNVALGYQALKTNTWGYDNTAVGYFALKGNTGGYYNTAIGHAAMMSNQTGGWNTAMGWLALKNNTVGGGNVAIGTDAMADNVSGGHNVALGAAALASNVEFYANVAVGLNALMHKVAGDRNVAIGSYAGKFVADGTTPLTATASCIYIGDEAKALHDFDYNSIVIGAGAVGAGPNTTVIGRPSTAATHLFGVITLNSHRIINVADPIAAQDAATKQYVDSKATALGNLSTVNLTSPASGEVLTYDAGTGKWINAPSLAVTTKWHNGSGEPSAGTGSNGDFYLDTDTNAYYVRTSTGWSASGTSLVGPQGQQGPQGIQGPKGDQGDQGPTGANGRTWHTGDGQPDGGLGEVGDLFLDTANSTIYRKTAADTWDELTSIRGVQGEVGPVGPAGPATLRVPEQGDLSMGQFKAGIPPQP